MSRAGIVAVVFTVGACATAGTADNQQQPPPSEVDAAVHPPTTPDAPPLSNPVDAPPAGCTTMTTDLLTNGGFDGSPAGSGWTASPVDPTYPIVTSDMVTGHSVHSSPNSAWMGGYAQANANDSMYQDVQIPAGATQLRLKGFYMVLTAETGTGVKDTANVELRTPGGSKIETVLTLDNTQATTSWVSLDHTFGTASAGQMVRLYFASASNATNATDFFYDSLQLLATHCD